MNHDLPYANSETSRKPLRQPPLSRQLALFHYLSMILRRLAQSMAPDQLSPLERRLLQQELAALKKAAQAARHRLKSARSHISRL